MSRRIDPGTIKESAELMAVGREKNRIGYIDGLRAIAVLSVVVFHAAARSASSNAHSYTAVSLILRQGCHGVDLFFILSGFCLAYPTLSRLHDRGRATFNVAGFASRRLIRIVPPYYAALAVFVTLSYALVRAHIRFPEGLNAQAFTLPAIVNQMLFLDGDRKFLDSSFWTLAIEFRWYFLFPIVLWVWTRSRAGFAIVGLAALIAGTTGFANVDLLFLPIFMLGIVAADIYVHERRIARVSYVMLPIMLVAAVASTAGSEWRYMYSGPFWGITMFLFVVAAGTTPLVRAVLSLRPLTLIGFASYGIYLVHEPVIGLVRELIGTPGEGYRLFAPSFVVSLVAGLLFSYVAERPFVSSGLKRVLVATVEGVLFRWFAACRVGTALDLKSSELPENTGKTAADSIVIVDAIETGVIPAKAGAQS